MSQEPVFCVTGITGQVGGAVAERLLAAGKRVRAVVRNRVRGARWAARGCEIAVADLADPPALAAALRGARGVFAMLPPLFDPSPGFPEARALSDAIGEALRSTRPGRIVALSTIGADATQPSLLSQLGLFEQALAKLDARLTLLRPAWFMENATLDLAQARDSGVISSFLQPLDRPVPVVSARDVGHVAAGLVMADDPGPGTTGPQVVALEAERRSSPLDLAQAFAHALGRPVRAEAMPRQEWEAIFRRQGTRNPLPRMQMLDGFNAGWIDFPDQGARARKAPTTLQAAIASLVAGAGPTRDAGAVSRDEGR